MTLLLFFFGGGALLLSSGRSVHVSSTPFDADHAHLQTPRLAGGEVENKIAVPAGSLVLTRDGTGSAGNTARGSAAGREHSAAEARSRPPAIVAAKEQRIVAASRTGVISSARDTSSIRAAEKLQPVPAVAPSPLPPVAPKQYTLDTSFMRLQAITWDPDPEVRFAVINDRILHLRESIDGIVVHAIEADAVILRKSEDYGEVRFRQRPGGLSE